MQETNFLKNDIIRLIDSKTESKNHDFKLTCNWNSKEKDAQLNIVKDILAMANTQDGGKIIFGVENSSYTLDGMSPEDFKSFDQTDVNQFLEKYTDPKFTVQVYKFDNIEGKNVVVINIPEFQEIPIICANNAHSSKDNNKIMLRKGAIYIRTEKASTEEIQTSEDMREFLLRAVRKNSDYLLHNIGLLISGIKVKSPDESIGEKYKNDLESFEKFIKETIGDELYRYGVWEVIAYPSEYIKIRLEPFSQMIELVKKYQVQLRGWYFPHILIYGNDPGKLTNFNNGIQSYVKYNEIMEGFRFYQNSLFSWKGSIIQEEDGITKESEKTLYFTSAIWRITEFFIFLKRIYEVLLSSGNIYIKIQITNCNNRKLISPSPIIYFEPHCISNEDSILIFDGEVDIIDLKIKYNELAKKSIQRLFEIFNCNNFPESSIIKWQEKLINKQFY